MYAQKLSFNYAHTLNTVRIVHNTHSVHRSRVQKGQSCDCINFVRATDPCAGSGHILAYMFDVLMQIYESYGYTTRDAVASIVEHNLHGLDIDDRAAQLAYFAVMMKARQYDRRFFSRGVQPHVYAIAESNHVDHFAVEYFCKGNEKLTAAMDTIISELHDAKEYGSILNITPQDWTMLYDRFAEITEDINMSRETALRELLPLVQTAEALAQKYDAVVTNPPYMGASGMSAKLSNYVKKNYPDSKSDLFAVFIEKCGQMQKKNGYQAMITQHAWMFLSSFEKLRGKLLHTDIVNMAHLGARAFEEIGGEVVQTTSFVIRKSNVADYKGEYCRLIEPTTQQGKEVMFLVGKNRYEAIQTDFSNIPGSPVAYWASQQIIRAFENSKLLAQLAKPRVGLQTSNNERFIRLWYEIDYTKMRLGVSEAKETIKVGGKWFPHNKGGEYRKWYGNNINVVDYENDGFDIKAEKAENLRLGLIEKKNSQCWNSEFYFKEALTWSRISSSNFGIRYSPMGFVFDTAGTCIFAEPKLLKYLLGLLTSNVVKEILLMLNPTLTFQTGDISNIPVIFKENDGDITAKVNSSIEISKNDWDSFEISWDFKKHPLIRKVPTIAEAFAQWQTECDERFNQLKANEEELNRIFINIYGLQNELTPDVSDKDITVHRIFDTKDDVPESIQGSKYIRTKHDEIITFISYAVGCMFGRYSLDMDSLVYAGGEWDSSKYVSFAADKDNIIPICDDEYFADDIVSRFIEFVKTVYGAETLDENLKFIADALGGKGQPKDVIRNYFLNDFYADHCRIYQKRPIYWLFDSGKKNGFKALIYMHRYQPDTIARIRTDYVHEQQARYRTAIADLEARAANASTSERVKLNKQLKTLNDQATEIHVYEEKIHHLADQMISIDLDDGVKVNYAKFQDVLAKIK